MSVSAYLKFCPEVTLYNLYGAYFPVFEPALLQPGLSALIGIVHEQTLVDFVGGVLEGYDGFGESMWVEIVEVNEETILGKTLEDNSFFKAGSYIHFTQSNVHRLKGSLNWSIENQTVLCSESILYHQEQIGYFFNAEIEQAWSFGRVFYSRSEIYEPKEGITLVEVPLATLLACDPMVGNYLECPALKGMIRVDDKTFQEYDVQPRDLDIFPIDYLVWDDEEEDEDDTPW